MASSRSRISRSKYWLVLALLLVGSFAHHADAGSKKRVVVLSISGSHGRKFHVELVRLLKHHHRVVSTRKWEKTADKMSASDLNESNIKKIARKLKVDGVIECRYRKRRGNYLLRMKLYSGATGEMVRKVNTKAEGSKIDGNASRDIRDELVSAIDDLKSVRGGSSADDDDEPKKVSKRDKDDDDDDADDDDGGKKSKRDKRDDDDRDSKRHKTSKFSSGKMADRDADDKGKKDDDDSDSKRHKSKFSKRDKDDDDDEVADVLKSKKDDDDDNKRNKRKKKHDDEDDDKDVASNDSDDDDDGVSDRAETGAKISKSKALAPAFRAIDATVGLSFNARRLTWKADADLASSAGTPGLGRPPNYNGLPATGATLDLEAYPMAFGRKENGMVRNIGLTVLYDRALLISSKTGDGTKLKTASERWLVGAAFRYPLGKDANSFVVGGRLAYGRQLFEIAGADLPNVGYSMIEPGVFIKLPRMGKLEFGADVSFQKILKSGDISTPDQYGTTSGTGLDLVVSGKYMLTPAIFARGAVNAERISLAFNGTGMLTTMRDGDMEQDVQGATDLYIGIAASIGFLY